MKLLMSILVLTIIMLAGCSSGTTTSTAQQSSPQASSAGEVHEITMTVKQWEFIPSTITVNQGDTVRLFIRSIDVTHGFGLPEFGVSARLSPGRETIVDFVADKRGTYSFLCTVSCGAGHSNMRGTLIVN